jgi:hypothetical protein
LASSGALSRHLDVAEQAGQDIVEIMRDAAGQLAHRLHLVHLADMVFGGGALGRFQLQPLIGVGQFAGARSDGSLQMVGALRLDLGGAAGGAVRAIGPPGKAQRQQHRHQQRQSDQARCPADPGIAVARQRDSDAAFSEARAFGVDDLRQQAVYTRQVVGLASAMELAQRAHLLVVGGAQADFRQALAAFRERRLELHDIVMLPAGAASGIGQRLELRRRHAQLVLEQAAGVAVHADDVAGQSDFGSRHGRFEAAGLGDHFETAALFDEGALMIAGGGAGAVEQRAHRADEQHQQPRSQGARQQSAPAHPPFHDVVDPHHRRPH